MTSSAKKKKDKKKDFQKTQLKVGKAKAKASNYTDTSFKARSIIVQTQSLSVEAPNAKAQFAHHVSMLKNHSDSQRAESLAFLTTALSQTTDARSLPESPATLIAKLQPLILDTSPKVRHQLMKVLECLPNEDVRAQTDKFLLYLHAAMTSLHASIRISSMDVIDWLMDSAGQEAVSTAGGWVKTLSCFLGLMGWQHSSVNHGGWSAQQRSSTRAGIDIKIVRRQLTALNRFLGVGLGSGDNRASGQTLVGNFPLHCMRAHLIPERSNAFAYLDLFGAPREDETQMLEDREDRQRVFAQSFASTCLAGVNGMIKEGGELGRSAGQLKRTIEEGLSGYQEEKGFS